ncbi:MAG: M48 family metallopeptidase [Saprospiraceae bacterium]
MRRIFFQGCSVVVLFFAAWFALRQVDWMSFFKVKQATESLEEKLGDIFSEIFGRDELYSSSVTAPIDSILTRLCTENDIDRDQIKLHIVDNDEVNAFALPDKHLVVFSGLILSAENESEVCGVLGHELAHIQLGHVMKKLVKEIGLSVLISMTAGGSGEVVREAAKMLSSSAFDRELEREADIKSVDYMVKADIRPEPFADFMFRLSGEETEIAKALTWVSTHPDSKDRAEYIIGYSKNKRCEYRPVLSEESWENLQKRLGEGE